MSRCWGSLTQTLNESGKPVCANIDCNAPLQGFDLTKNQRFCRKCRIKGVILRWRCKGCNNIISDTVSRFTRQYCNQCNYPDEKDQTIPA